MYGKQHDPRGSGHGSPGGKKSGHAKQRGPVKGPKSSSSASSKEAPHQPFQPVLLRHQEPREKHVEEVTSRPSPDQGHTQQVPVVLKSAVPAPSSSSSTTSHATTSAPAIKSPVRIEPEAPTRVVSSEPSPSLRSSSSAPSRPDNAELRASESLLEKVHALPPVFRLLSEANQFQVSLTEELRTFLDCTAEVFPASSAVSNPAVQGEVTVIGVLGTQNSGKSTLLNALASCASPLFPSTSSTATTQSTPYEPTSVLDFLATHTRETASSCHATSTPSSASTLAPFSVNPIITHAKTLVSSQKHFSIDMAVVERPNGRLFESTGATSLSSRTNSSDCFILLEIQSLPNSSMLSATKRGDAATALASDVRNQEQNLQLLSLQIGLFALSVCNTVVVVDESTCNVNTWKHLKTLEMLKWSFPEISELFYSAPNLSVYIPQLRNSFIDARRRETYETMMMEIVANAKKERKNDKTFIASESDSKGSITSNSNSTVQNTQTDSANPSKKNKKNRKNAKRNARDQTRPNASSTSSNSANASQSNQWPLNLAADLTIDEQNVNALSGALDRINIYSPEQEYLPSLLFAFNKVSRDCVTPLHEHRVRKALNAYFESSSFVSRVSSSSRLPFVLIPESQTPSTTNHREIPEMQEFVGKLLSLQAPRFRKPLNPREWLIASCWMWEIIKTSPVLAQYNMALRQAAYGRKEAGSSTST